VGVTPTPPDERADEAVLLCEAGWSLARLGMWDFVYLRLDKVVARSYAEWCGVFDILVAAQLVLLP
jgi:hypothetical protein